MVDSILSLLHELTSPPMLVLISEAYRVAWLLFEFLGTFCHQASVARQGKIRRHIGMGECSGDPRIPVGNCPLLQPGDAGTLA